MSDRNKFIFVHIPKTGGTSVEKYLNVHRNNAAQLFGPIEASLRRENGFFSSAYQHLTAREIKRVVGESVFGKYFKFSFVRNPWDRVVSNYFDQSATLGMPYLSETFEDFVEGLVPHSHVHYLSQREFVCDADGRQNVDFIGRFERFEDDFKKVLEKIKVPYEAQKMPWIFRAPRIKDYRHYYSQASQKKISELYATDIDQFQYVF